MTKKALQVVTAMLGLVPLGTGLIGLMGLSDPLYASLGIPAAPILDSNPRFLSGVWLGLGCAVLWMVPRIESQGVLIRALWGMIFLGGVGRVLSAGLAGWPPAPFIAFTALEIVGAPLFVYWQARVAMQVSGAASKRRQPSPA
ncbi:DUF4345 domain-containing protein [Pseudoduganella armeniaca]|uniref:DUF4345 domain-containing protein n=1 Tax=Pseudoduganella armeniaca TaxID=2072590 RepID=A0A2R4CD60_9BURK|nr:DUF4345 domain-containing protein [Pseudoduganella armeniaca]AVR97545.1 DUF4345 domain-containing protein [Pseudoduganella armeniaca]